MASRSTVAAVLPLRSARSVSASRSRRRAEAQRGNVRALRHGIFAQVYNAPEVAIEVDLIYATHPALDELADRRLAEQLAANSVQRARCLLAMQADGTLSDRTLAAYDAKLAPLVERLERAVHERDRERRREAQARSAAVDLSRYKPGGVA